MATPTAQQFLANARTYLGVVESPFGSNRTRVGVEFGWNGVPWCAEFLSVVAENVGFGRKFWSASTDVWEANARRGVNGARWLVWTTRPLPGDICVWDWKRDGTANHVSVVETVRSDGKLVTIGGNESNRCQRAVRTKYGLRGFIRLPYRILAVSTTNHPGIGPGSKGPAVREWQHKLNTVVGSRLVEDGDFGAKTKEVTLAFKRYTKLIPTWSKDANVGPKTWALMDAAYLKKIRG